MTPLQRMHLCDLIDRRIRAGIDALPKDWRSWPPMTDMIVEAFEFIEELKQDIAKDEP